MHLGEISFCDRIGYNIKCDETKASILKRFEDMYGISIVRKHHQKYASEMLPMLNNAPYLVSLRTNGNPYLLYLTRHHGVNTCIFIDKKIQQGYFQPRMILTKMWFDDDLFNDTLMDGEMVKDKQGHWTYLINDLIVDGQVHLTKVNLIKRYERLQHILTHKYVHDVVVPFHVETKEYVEYHQLKDLLQKVPSLPYTCRGIYFKPLHLKFKDILLNFDDSVVIKVTKTKYKTAGNFLTSPLDIEPGPCPSAHQEQKGDIVTHTTSTLTHLFHIKKTSTPDVYEMLDPETGEVHIACVNTLATSELLYHTFYDKNLLDRVPFRCHFSEKFGKWIPVESLVNAV